MTPRLLVHPGPVDPVRRESLAEPEGRALRIRLAPGAALQEGLVAALRMLGADSASFTLLGGRFAALRYCIAAPNPQGPQVARYSAPIPAGTSRILAGGGALGLTPQRTPVVHCHAVLTDAAGGVFGGHLLPSESIADAQEPPILLARVFTRVAILQRPDPETAMTIFHPFGAAHG